jgi:hypothetical protein
VAVTVEGVPEYDPKKQSQEVCGGETPIRFHTGEAESFVEHFPPTA